MLSILISILLILQLTILFCLLSGLGNSIFLSSLPGLKRAGSRQSALHSGSSRSSSRSSSSSCCCCCSCCYCGWILLGINIIIVIIVFIITIIVVVIIFLIIINILLFLLFRFNFLFLEVSKLTLGWLLIFYIIDLRVYLEEIIHLRCLFRLHKIYFVILLNLNDLLVG